MRTISKEELKELYDKDFPLWVEINLELLKEKAYDLVDWENLLEEIEDMGLRHLESCTNLLCLFYPSFVFIFLFLCLFFHQK